MLELLIVVLLLAWLLGAFAFNVGGVIHLLLVVLVVVIAIRLIQGRPV
jgi:hypothetical protein